MNLVLGLFFFWLGLMIVITVSCSCIGFINDMLIEMFDISLKEIFKKHRGGKE